MTNADAKALGNPKPPYTSLKEYFAYKKLDVPQESIDAAIRESENANKIENETADSE